MNVFCKKTLNCGKDITFFKGKKYEAIEDGNFHNDISYYIKYGSGEDDGSRFWIYSDVEDFMREENLFNNYFELLIDNRKRKLNNIPN
jgi:hypothetical protein